MLLKAGVLAVVQDLMMASLTLAGCLSTGDQYPVHSKLPGRVLVGNTWLVGLVYCSYCHNLETGRIEGGIVDERNRIAVAVAI